MRLCGTHFYPRPSYGSQGWTVSIHPEGKRYAYNTTKDGISVVTEAQITEPGVAELLESSVAMLRALADQENVQLPATTEIFLEIDQDTETCSYWFADHAHRTVFWLHPLDTDASGLPESHSKRHLRESHASFGSSINLISSARVLPGGELLGPCGNVPCHRIAIFRDCLERAHYHSFERPCR